MPRQQTSPPISNKTEAIAAARKILVDQVENDALAAAIEEMPSGADRGSASASHIIACRAIAAQGAALAAWVAKEHSDAVDV